MRFDITARHVPDPDISVTLTDGAKPRWDGGPIDAVDATCAIDARRVEVASVQRRIKRLMVVSRCLLV